MGKLAGRVWKALGEESARQQAAETSSDRARRERWYRTEEKVAKTLTGRCSLFCGDMECPEKCPKR